MLPNPPGVEELPQASRPLGRIREVPGDHHGLLDPKIPSQDPVRDKGLELGSRVGFRV